MLQTWVGSLGEGVRGQGQVSTTSREPRRSHFQGQLWSTWTLARLSLSLTLLPEEEKCALTGKSRK